MCAHWGFVDFVLQSRAYIHTQTYSLRYIHTQSYVYKNIKAHTYMHTSMHVYFTYTYIHAQICTSTHIYHILACSLYFFTLTNRYCCASDSFFVSDRMISRRWLHTQRTNQLHLELMGFKPLLNIFWNRLGMSVPLGPASGTPPPSGLLQRHALDVVCCFCSLSYQVVNMWGYPVL